MSNLSFLTGASLELTLALVKPDAVEAGHLGRIISEMEKHFLVGDVVSTTWPAVFAGFFYEEHVGKPYYSDLVSFMSSGRLCMVALVAPNAVEKWRTMMGATDPMKAEFGTIRNRFAPMDGVIMHNAVHGSDSIESVGRELGRIRKQLYVRPDRGELCFPTFGEEAHKLIEKYKNKKWTLSGRVFV